MPSFYTDLKLTQRTFDREVSDRQGADILISPGGDLATVGDRTNLAQAILNRLLTRKGELTQLGHPDYGSRLHTLIGELNTTRMQGFATLYIRECLAQESRIQTVKQLTFAPPSRGIDRNVMEVTITVQPVGQSEDLTFTLALNLGG
jgi:phage baseplate assembly protein W